MSEIQSSKERLDTVIAIDPHTRAQTIGDHSITDRDFLRGGLHNFTPRQTLPLVIVPLP